MSLRIEQKTALVACIATASFLIAIQQLLKYREIRRIKQENAIDWSKSDLPESNPTENEELVQEQLSRNTLFLGAEVISSLT